MNNIITQKRLVELIASTAQCSSDIAQAFIVALSNSVKDALQKDKSAKIKDVGEFLVTADGKIRFVPDAHLAEAINAPFDMFQPEVLSPGITAEELNKPLAKIVVPEAPLAETPAEPAAEAPSTEIPTEQPAEQEVEEEAAEQIEEEIPAEKVAEETQQVSEEVQEGLKEEAQEEPKEEAQDVPKEEVQEEPEKPVVKAPSKAVVSPYLPEEDEEEEDPRYDEVSDSETSLEKGGGGFPTFMVIMGLLVGLILGCGIGFFLHDPIQEMLEPTLAEAPEEQISDADLALLDIFSEDSVEEAQEAQQEAAAEPQQAAQPTQETPQTPAKDNAKDAAPAAKPQAKADVYDTVTSNLAALSKKHYGDKAYWVYIYLENKSAIPNPNKVGANVRLKIPPLEKYATQATEAERKAAANRKAAEILAQYK